MGMVGPDRAGFRVPSLPTLASNSLACSADELRTASAMVFCANLVTRLQRIVYVF